MIYDLLAPIYDSINSDIDYSKWADFIEKILDSYLEKNEFKKWCKRNYNKLIYWFNSIENLGKSYYYARHYIEYEHKEKRILFGKKNIYYTIYKHKFQLH